MHDESPFANEPVCDRIAEGLARVALALRSHATRAATKARLSPAQGQVLTLLGQADGMRLSALALRLGVSAPTASDVVRVLVQKGFVEKRAAADARGIALRLTVEGEAMTERVAEWPSFLRRALARLDRSDQDALLELVIKLVLSLQHQGDIDPPSMCVTCRHFRPWTHQGAKPHHCAFVDAPFGDCDLRLDCRDHALGDDRDGGAWLHPAHGA